MNLIPQKEVLIYFFFLQIWSKSFLFVKQKKKELQNILVFVDVIKLIEQSSNPFLRKKFFFS
jgi:hypothetical protein